MSKKLAYLVIFSVLSLTGFFGYQASQLDFNYDFETFFPKNDPETRFFLEHRDRFVTDNDFVILGINNEKGLFQKEFLNSIQTLTDSLNQLELVDYVVSPTSLTYPVQDPVFKTVFQVPFIHSQEPSKYNADSLKILNSPEILGSYVSQDFTCVMVYVRHKPKLADTECRQITTEVKRVIEQHQFDTCFLNSRCDAQGYYIDLMQKELLIFVGASVILILIFLILAYRSFWGVWVPAVVVTLSVIWIMGIMQLTGKKIDLLLTILPTIMFVIGLSDAIHLISKYIEELRLGKSQNEAIIIAYKEVGIATFLTSVTTAIGFLTLITSTIIPIIDLGIYVAIGVVVAFLLAYTILPAILSITKPPKIAAVKGVKTLWYRWLHTLFLWVLGNQKKIVLIFAIGFVVALVGTFKIKLNNYLLEDLKADNPLQKGFRFIENNFDGCRPYEASLKLVDTTKTVYDLDVLLALDSIENYLQTNHEVGFCVSPLTFVKTANRALHGGHQEYYTIPNKNDLKKITKELVKNKDQNQIKAIVSPSLKVARLSGRTPDVGSHKLKILNESFLRFTERFNSILEIKITGTAHLIDKNNQYISANVLEGLLIAFAVIGLIVGLLYRSLSLVGISLLVNVFPLLLIGAIMGFFNVDLKLSTAIIFTIAFGIAVDDTIHFLSKYKLELNKKTNPILALKRTYLSTGKAIIVTSLILCGGFLTLALSEFLGTFYIGLLISLTLLFAVITDIILLPVLLIWTSKFLKK